jgi:hypothetical protein
MRAFGYGDVRMFFIPFFGAAVSGKRRNVAPWKEGVVLLLGPLPGIVAAFVIALRIRHSPAESVAEWHALAVSLVSINGFNLLPLAGLDGAQLLQHVLFSRRRWLEVGFQVLAALGMAAVAIDSRSIALGVFTYLMLALVPYRWRLLGKARQLRDGGVPLPPDARELDDETGRGVFMAASGLTTRDSAKTVAAVMEQLVDAVNARPPSLGGSLALASTWFVALVFAFGTLGLLYRPTTDGSPTALPILMPASPSVPSGPGPHLKLGGDEDFKLRLKQPGE